MARAWAALRAAPSSHNGLRRSCRPMVSVVSAEPATRTGWGTMSMARSLLVKTTAAEPSPAGAMSNRFTGSATSGAPGKRSALIRFWNMAIGFWLPLAWAFTLKPAKSASVTPYSCM